MKNKFIMNRSLALVIIILFCVVACKEKSKQSIANNYIKNSNAVKLTPWADSLFKSYVAAVNSDNGYAVYIDMKTKNNDYMITFAPIIRKINYMNADAVNYFMLRDTLPVLIYTGLESFTVHDSITKDSMAYEHNIDYARSWSYVHLVDTAYLVKGNNAPFMKLTLKPSIIWHAPDPLKAIK